MQMGKTKSQISWAVTAQLVRACFCSIGSMVPLLNPKSQALLSVVEQPGLLHTWLETHFEGFLMQRLIYLNQRLSSN